MSGAPIAPALSRFSSTDTKSSFLRSAVEPNAASAELPHFSSTAHIPLSVRMTSEERLSTEVPPSTSSSKVLGATPAHVEDSSTILEEPPLKRPYKPGTPSGPVEPPLGRPKDKSEDIAFSDTIATFAVDVSGSTAGKVLEEEKDVITTLCSGLSRDAVTQVDVIPWCDYIQNVIRPSELDSLYSSGGTCPSQLNSSVKAKKALSKCSAWFLLTDGEVLSQEVRCFSDGICNAGLHGTPCVIVLFGYKTSRPIGCNISVGLSVFSNAADCLFLFHDIDTTQVYIIQAKGVFKTLLPVNCQTLLLDSNTLWNDLPHFEYRQLFDLPLPARHQLRPDDLILQGRHHINLQDIYKNRIRGSEASAILNNNDHLQAVMLAAQVRGDDNAIRNWISEQKITGDDDLLFERPDLNQEAARLLRRLLAATATFTSGGNDRKIRKLRSNLRAAHYANWRAFMSTLASERNQKSERSLIIADAMMRLDNNLLELEDTGTKSPALLSPAPRRPSGFTTSPSGPSPSGPSISALKSTFFRGGPEILYIKGYECQSTSSDDRFDATCPLCEEHNVLLILLLKRPPKNLSTPDFPGPSQRKHLAYPLAMGTYPETDLLSACMCCDSCAATLLRDNICPNGDEMTAAIPLMKAAFSGKFKERTFDSVDTALQRRFHRSSVELVFLSIIHATYASLDGGDTQLQSEALKQASSWIAMEITLPANLSLSIVSTPRTPPRTLHASLSSKSGDSIPLSKVLQDNFKNVLEPEAPILRYPLSGFIVMTMTITWMNRRTPTIDHETIRLAVWHRFLFHLVEKHSAAMFGNREKAQTTLQSILQRKTSNLGIDEDAMDTAQEEIYTSQRPTRSMSFPETSQAQDDSPIFPSTICDTHLLSEEDLEDFQSLLTLFEPLEKYSSSALRSFLTRLSQSFSLTESAMENFDRIRAQDDLWHVFAVPGQQGW